MIDQSYYASDFVKSMWRDSDGKDLPNMSRRVDAQHEFGKGRIAWCHSNEPICPRKGMCG